MEITLKYWCALYSFDQVMASASCDISDRDDWKVFHREMEAQFYFHCGTVVLNKALKVIFTDMHLGTRTTQEHCRLSAALCSCFRM